jgi:hypothetical protein
VSRRARLLSFGSCGVLVLAGALCGVLIDTPTGEVLTLGFLLFGLGGALLLLFLEVGLSEDRERAKEEESRRAREARLKHPERPGRSRWPRRPG